MSLNWRLENPRLMLGVACGFAIGNFIVNIAPQAISGLMDTYAFQESEAGLINSIEIMALALVCTLLSPILHRIDHRKLIVVGTAMVIAGNAGAALVADFTGLALFRGFAGAGAGMILAAAGAAVAAARDPDRLYAEVAAVITVSMTVAIFLLAGIKENWGYPGVMVAFGGAALLCVVPMLYLIPAVNPGAEEDRGGFFTVLIGPGFFGIFAMLVFSVLESSIWNFAERAAINAGLDEHQIATLLAVSMLSGLIGAALTVVAGKTFGRELPIAAGCALIGLCGYFMYDPPSRALLIGSIAIFNLGYFFVIPFIFGGCAQLDKSGRLTGVAAGMQVLGGAVGPGFAGFVLSSLGYTSLAVVCLSLAAVAALAGISMALLIRRHNRGVGAAV